MGKGRRRLWFWPPAPWKWVPEGSVCPQLERSWPFLQDMVSGNASQQRAAFQVLPFQGEGLDVLLRTLEKTTSLARRPPVWAKGHTGEGNESRLKPWGRAGCCEDSNTSHSSLPSSQTSPHRRKERIVPRGSSKGTNAVFMTRTMTGWL